MTAIYSLSDPVTGFVRYIGMTKLTLQNRLQLHVSEANNKTKRHRHKHRWIAQLKRKGLKPIIRLVEVVPPGMTWQEAEILWIGKYRKNFPRHILNHHDGGTAGAPKKGHRISEETRQKIIATLKGRVLRKKPFFFSEEQRRKIGEKSRGRKVSEQARKKISDLHQGRVKSKAECQNISAARKRHLLTEEGQQLMRKAVIAGLTRIRINRMARRVTQATKLNMAA
jgi:hypothetical protein